MKIASYQQKEFFLDKCIVAYKEKRILFKRVNCYQTEIINQLEDYECYWNNHLNSYDKSIRTQQWMVDGILQ